MLLLLLGLLMFFVYAAQADTADSCRYVVPATVTVLLLAVVDSSGVTAVTSLAPPPLLGCRCYSPAIFLFSVMPLVRRVAAHPRFPPRFRRRRLQHLCYLARKHTKIKIGKIFTCFAEGK